MMPPEQYAASEVRRAVKGIGTDDSSLIELLCSRTGFELRQIAEAYKEMFKSDMAQAVQDDTSGDYGECSAWMVISPARAHGVCLTGALLVALARGDRDDKEAPEAAKARDLASRLYKAGWRPRGRALNSMMCSNVPLLQERARLARTSKSLSTFCPSTAFRCCRWSLTR